jgi:hypothetical protein
MLKHNKQQIKVTVHQTKIVSDALQSFFLKIKVGENFQNSEKISEKVFDIKKVK